MKRSQMFNETFSILIRNGSLWIVTLSALGLSALVGLVLPATNLASVILHTIVSFAVTAFLAGALIRMVDSIAERQTVTVNDGFEAGIRRFVPLLIVRVVLMLPTWIVLILATGSFLSIFSEFGQPGGLPVTSIANLAGALLGIVGLILVLGVITSAIGVGADRAVVLENLPVVEALLRGVSLLVSKLVDFIFIGLMMFVVALAIGILFWCISSVIGLPLAMSGFDYGEAIDVPLSPSAIPGTTLISTIINLIVGTLTAVLFSGVWTLAFRQWQGKEPILSDT